jgi:hypothetical protein
VETLEKLAGVQRLAENRHECGEECRASRPISPRMAAARSRCE